MGHVGCCVWGGGYPVGISISYSIILFALQKVALQTMCGSRESCRVNVWLLIRKPQTLLEAAMHFEQ